MKSEANLPEVIEFLKVLRIVNRQLKFFKSSDLDKDHKEVIENATKKTVRKINTYLEGEV